MIDSKDFDRNAWDLIMYDQTVCFLPSVCRQQTGLYTCEIHDAIGNGIDFPDIHLSINGDDFPMTDIGDNLLTVLVADYFTSQSSSEEYMYQLMSPR